ncbi:hypothetical protein LU293_04390 [Moraxella nasovis]|uniref:hypothetical protein n=1 Tax=Moraxella nasovis TaxID=2904121 RepID=UPI001F6017D4|nr:hypothetical protein [Moraxella nasovis]UNU74142.1 hypothetical protein LU293_04390 [Moraxella nasovis]
MNLRKRIVKHLLNQIDILNRKLELAELSNKHLISKNQEVLEFLHDIEPSLEPAHKRQLERFRYIDVPF